MKRFLRKQLPAVLLVLAMMVSLMPAASAARADLTVSVEAGDEVTLSRSDFRSIYNADSSVSSNFSYMTFTDFDDLKDYGYFTATNKNGRTVTLDEDDLDNLWFYDSGSDIEYDGDCQLSGLTFVADDDADDGTLTLKFSLVGEKSRDTVSGTLAIEVDGSGSSSGTISYTVKAGNTVDLNASDFYDFFRENYGSSTRSLRYVVFSYPASSAFANGTLYYNYGRSSEESFTRSSLSRATFYYGNNYTYGEYDLDNLTFAASKSFSGDISLPFRAYYDENRYVDGTVEITTSGKTSSAKGDIKLEVNPGSYVNFDEDDFYDYFQETYSSYGLRYVVFTDSDNLSSSTGYVYYNYGRSSQERFTASSLEYATFYYDTDYMPDNDESAYPLNKLSFVAASGFTGTATLEFRAYYNSSRYVDGTVTITSSKSGTNSGKGDIKLEVDPGDSVDFDEDDFYDYFRETYSSYGLRYVVFTDSDNLSSSTGYVYYNYGRSSQERFTASSLEYATFYYDTDYMPDNDESAYPLNKLSFVAASGFSGTVTLEFRAYYSTNRYVDGTMTITSSKSSGTTGEGDINYKGTAQKETVFDEDDFNDYFQETYKNYTLKYVVFTDSDNLSSTTGYMYYNYGRSSQERFTAGGLEDATFYYDADDVPDNDNTAYPLSKLSFVAGSGFDKAVTLEFRAYYNSSRYVDGTVVIAPETATTTGTAAGDILYQTTSTTKVQLKANDFSRFLRSKYPTSTLQYVKLLGVPSVGGLYYNYYSASQYGTTARVQLTAANCTTQAYYVSPTSAAQYTLSELTYVPSGSNYCAAIPFTAYGTGGVAVTGIAIISVTASATVPEVYGVITKGTSVSFPAPSIAAAVAKSIGTFYGIQLLSLPASAKGTVYVGTGTTRKADTSTVYGYSSGTWTISQLRFVPAAGFTGNVEIPYAVCDSTGKALGVGKFSLGVVNTQKKFSDVTASTWCYKYVAELSDAGVIDGYTDGSFKPDNKISYGAALKLIMLAAGYPEQKPTDSNAFSGYLAKARAEGIITRSNVNLSAPITRLQVAQLAAGAMKLDTSKVSSVKPFTDTTDASVQALNEAGIVEGYFSNGTSTYKPGNTLTRGQVSAIVWRMGQYRK